jgi:hypothetical protein
LAGALTALAWWAFPTPAVAQGSCAEVLGETSCPIETGMRLRVGEDGSAPLFTGTAISITGRELSIRTDEGPTVATVWARLQTLERSTGRRRHPVAGALVGAGVAVAVMGIAIATKECGIDYCSGGVDPQPGLIFGGSMTLAGAIVGWLIRTEGWESLFDR